VKDGYGPHVWNQGVARRKLIGGRTMNPTPAATSLIGKKALSRGRRALKRVGRKSYHRGNPAPAVLLALASKLGLLKSLPFSGPDAAKQKIRIEKLNQYAQETIDGNGTSWQHLQAVARREELHGVAINDETVNHAKQLVTTINAHMAAKAAGAAPVASPFNVASLAPLAVPIVRELAKKPKAPRRQRYPSYTDRYGRQKYSYKPPGSDFKLPAGAAPTAGSPYSFFRGAIGKGGAGTTAGQLAVAGAAGAAAYLMTQKLLQYLGGRTQAKEEAGVNAARAHRETLLQLQAQGPGRPTAAEKAEVKEAYRAKLVELGYDPVTFTRTRSATENFFETYNPFT